MRNPYGSKQTKRQERESETRRSLESQQVGHFEIMK